MSDRPTPETDAAQHEGLLRGHPTPTLVVRASFARRLERQRDEARKLARELRDALEKQVSLPYDRGRYEYCLDLFTKAEEVLG